MAMESTPPDLCVVDLGLASFSSFKLISYLREQHPAVEILVVGDPNRSRDQLRQALSLGANDCLFLPLHDRLSVEARIGNMVEKIRLKRPPAAEPFAPSLPFLVGAQGDLGRLLRRLQASLPLTGSTLLVSEAGAGKKTVARALQSLMGLEKRPVTFAYLPRLSRTELKEEWGRLQSATQMDRLFYFDGVEDLDVSRQHHLYGVLQQWNMSESRTPVLFSARPSLFEKLERRDFREDLFHLISDRIWVIPPLRDRKEDFPQLIDYFSREWSKQSPSLLALLTREACDALWSYSWPGNVRQLRQLVENCLLRYRVTPKPIDIGDLPENFLSASAYVLRPEEERDLLLPYREAKDKSLAKFHENYIIYLLKRAKGNISAAAVEAGLDRSNFKKIMQKYRIRAEQFR